ncbi:hypothetical protein A3F00_01615 [Candidatus Daviesbacteria bacterium RIFCSPHIGHO2_12_FULL_37_11]|uniref:IrrE N-terminal-like domain-containing protein n=1 Tax=Candidatus Daviesbacteria bacterium RIFCSPHIGHO2_12_FULL_37_11 TaxID=1797777 RepID=A0A1F5KDB2_9BACT|nr:MAG: hypothetical protein A2111_01245 [Candidatus Daviesbacteria bacterium GWA1_38_6]OGE16476.1 MAG: hypothetical protein A2769_02260 [Candidatus Daviesbacteria bacterium RIFCSPHIGHO2_01_FULL_37_27]OGE38571.1 MAG: hypothetical protein A3F00_01615 [Candidatus Daviesbacteria bacterium RIFCSPHIGHO2_12_FULL_37_11]OGE46282.1 MAG: hypothetical protein A3B39_03840 [Candidatus Daviesbacteria bacterium RIFCSPLOWO2_01_FULL_37_10]
MLQETEYSTLRKLEEYYLKPYYGINIVTEELRDYLDAVLEVSPPNYRKKLYLSASLTPGRKMMRAIHSVAHILLEHQGCADENGKRLIIELKDLDPEDYINAQFKHRLSEELEHNQASILTHGLINRNFQRRWKNLYPCILENSPIPDDYEDLYQSALSFNQFLISQGIVI